MLAPSSEYRQSTVVLYIQVTADAEMLSSHVTFDPSDPVIPTNVRELLYVNPICVPKLMTPASIILSYCAEIDTQQYLFNGHLSG